MTWWNRLKKIMASEAQDAKEELDKLRDAVDLELSRKEREMNATPSERLEMILEDIDADQVRLEAIEAGLKADTASEAGPDENAVTHPVAKPEEPLEPDEPSGSEEPPRRARLLGPGDVPAHPHLATVLEWVSVTLVGPAARTGTLAEFDHRVWIHESAGSAVGDGRLSESVTEAKNHPLILDAIHENGQVLLVQAPGLHPEDVRLVVAAAIARHVPDDWKEQLGD